MSTVYTKTDNYSLNLYGDNDPADLRDGYNGSMRTIDTTLETHLNRIEGVEARETHDEAVIKALLVDNTVDNATAAKTKWDKAASSSETNKDAITSIDANLNALHANTASDAQALYHQIQSNKNDIDALRPGGIAVFVGDSISEGYGASDSNHRFTTLTANRLGLIEKNYSRHGAGWTQRSPKADGLTAPQLVQNAVADKTYNHDDVALVVVEFGINDNNMNAFDGIISSNLIALQESFPKARYLLLNTLSGGCTSSTQYNKPSSGGDASGEIMSVFGMGNVISETNAQAAMTKFSVLQAWQWFSMAGASRSKYTTDSVHPNNTGHSKVANYVISAYYGALDAGIFPNVASFFMNVTIDKDKINTLGNKYYTPLGMYTNDIVSTADIVLPKTTIVVGKDVTTIRFTITINNLAFSQNPDADQYLPLWEMGLLFKKGVHVNKDSYKSRNQVKTTILMSDENNNTLPSSQMSMAYDPAYGVLSLAYHPTTVAPTKIHGIYVGEITVPTLRNYVYLS